MDEKDRLAGGRMERKKEDTKQKIIAAMLQLFQQNGIEATTMEDIAAAADIAKGTLYNYFPVKEAIISDYIQRASLEKNAERIERMRSLPDTRARLVLCLNELLGAIRAQQEIFEKYFTYRVQQMISLQKTNQQEEGGLLMLEREIIRLGQQSGEIRDDLPADILEGFFEFIFIEIAQQFYKDPAQFKMETINRCVELFLNGASRPKP